MRNNFFYMGIQPWEGHVRRIYSVELQLHVTGTRLHRTIRTIRRPVSHLSSTIQIHCRWEA